MEPYQFKLNGEYVQLLERIPERVTSLEVLLHINVRVEHGMGLHIKTWLNDIMDRLDCEYVTYQGILIPTKELKRF